MCVNNPRNITPFKQLETIDILNKNIKVLDKKMTTINKYKPCLQYKLPFDKEEGKTLKLKNTTNNKEGKIRLMMGSSAEEVLYTIKAFENKAVGINLLNNQRIKEFMNCLGSKARDRWAKLVKNGRGGDFSSNQWNQAKREWIAEYVKDKKAKETILSAWTSTKDFMKPKEADIKDHADRIKIICNYIHLLPGDHSELTDMERKSLLLFNTFPMTWCDKFTLNQNDPEQASKKRSKTSWRRGRTKLTKRSRVKQKLKLKPRKWKRTKRKGKIRKEMNHVDDIMMHTFGRTAQQTQAIGEEVKAEELTIGTMVEASEEVGK